MVLPLATPELVIFCVITTMCHTHMCHTHIHTYGTCAIPDTTCLCSGSVTVPLLLAALHSFKPGAVFKRARTMQCSSCLLQTTTLLCRLCLVVWSQAHPSLGRTTLKLACCRLSRWPDSQPTLPTASSCCFVLAAGLYEPLLICQVLGTEVFRSRLGCLPHHLTYHLTEPPAFAPQASPDSRQSFCISKRHAVGQKGLRWLALYLAMRVHANHGFGQRLDRSLLHPMSPALMTSVLY